MEEEQQVGKAEEQQLGMAEKLQLGMEMVEQPWWIDLEHCEDPPVKTAVQAAGEYSALNPGWAGALAGYAGLHEVPGQAVVHGVAHTGTG